uniref:Uncharacterized protein n=1 Tax=Chromera velia CCMP2878 TaxID=1169474 RepID=A0A0G4G8P2_9ALVE|eukprot:Cvel_20664.t1-p1 / transcript=Cvel_20664.t1 / gene=Cvel_20664 / organism=Chromera_velia_CCMP2878 / gene_product=hypothetical protein / transcript_product=hypothetical protein / location=Cvel_scaffold1876:7744-8859(+) / protein_length=372 / sequence_SO=supercontig / SO=protein_coding / is_pseudo=false
MMLSEEEQLRLALEASLEDDQTLKDNPLASSEDLCLRSDLVDVPRVPNPASHSPDGFIQQIPCCNQFFRLYHQIIKDTPAPSSLCGFFTVAFLELVLHFLKERKETAATVATSEGATPHAPLLEADLDRLLAILKDHNSALPLVTKWARFVADSRRKYLSEHPAEFPNERSRTEYLKAWVANYEISDMIKSLLIEKGAEYGESSGSGGVLLDSVFFVRFNQWPQREVATHEERQRLEQEKRFGGEFKRDTGESLFPPGSQELFLESFDLAVKEGKTEASSFFSTAEEFLQKIKEKGKGVSDEGGKTGEGNSLRLLAMDLNGHFAFALMFRDPAALTPRFLLYNTTNTKYIRTTRSVGWAFDLFCENVCHAAD